jgi:hypothetical protein
MNRLLQFAVCGIVAIGVASPTFGAPLSVIKNGGFESPALADGQFSSTVTDWTVSGNAGAWNPRGVWAREGDQVGLLKNAGASLSQVVAGSAANSTYTLKYSAGVKNFESDTSLLVEVFAGSKSLLSVGTTWEIADSTSDRVDWVGFTWNFTTTTTDPLTIRFKNNSDPAGGIDSAISIDRVSLTSTSVPEPSSLVALASMGIVGATVGLRRWRRNK